MAGFHIDRISEDIKRELTQCLNDIRDIREYIRTYNQE
jgi:hypothetical protein